MSPVYGWFTKQRQADRRRNRRSVLPIDGPYRLGPFVVDDTGGLTPPRDRAAVFCVRWRGCVVRAALGWRDGPEAGAPSEMALTLHAILGRVPSSAATLPAQRGAMLETLRLIAGCAPAMLRLRLRPDHSVQLQAERALPQPVTARRLLTELAGFILEAAPYFDLVAASGGAPAGTVKT